MAVTTQHPDPRHPRNDHARSTPAEVDALRRHRVDVVRRLLERGLSTRSIGAILQGWEAEIAMAAEEIQGTESEADRG